MDNTSLKKTLLEPDRPDSIPHKAQWLSGEGAGSWFYINSTKVVDVFEVIRFSPSGQIECEGFFKLENVSNLLSLQEDYKFVHLSHCATVRIRQEHKTLTLERIED